MLVDPLSEDPLVVTGSANFSRPSQRTNDENMLVIRGNKRVADIYFGGFMRVFDHHYARYIVRVLTDEGRSNPEAGYLKREGRRLAAVTLQSCQLQVEAAGVFRVAEAVTAVRLGCE
jgi:phosphatidylserine/phosphatidylglycerophosphate/cardiolipin synthase-like enzyme